MTKTLPEGVLEEMHFGRYGVRIRRSGVGELGRDDANGREPYLLEHREPGDRWRTWGVGHFSFEGAQWVRYGVWGGPEPA